MTFSLFNLLLQNYVFLFKEKNQGAALELKDFSMPMET